MQASFIFFIFPAAKENPWVLRSVVIALTKSLSSSRSAKFLGRPGLSCTLVQNNIIGVNRYRKFGMPTYASTGKLSPLSANPTKWSGTLKQLVGNLLTHCLSVFDHFVKLALKLLRYSLVILHIILSNFRYNCLTATDDTSGILLNFFLLQFFFMICFLLYTVRHNILCAIKKVSRKLGIHKLTCHTRLLFCSTADKTTVNITHFGHPFLDRYNKYCLKLGR